MIHNHSSAFAVIQFNNREQHQKSINNITIINVFRCNQYYFKYLKKNLDSYLKIYSQKLTFYSLIKKIKTHGFISKINSFYTNEKKTKIYILYMQINPLFDKLIISNYKSLSIPINFIYQQFEKQVSLPVNYNDFHQSLQNIYNWYIRKGFRWVIIRWHKNTHKKHVIITLNIYEGKIDKIILLCKSYNLNAKKLNNYIMQDLNIYKNDVLNAYKLEQKLKYIKKKYCLNNIYYIVKYNMLLNKIILTIHYKKVSPLTIWINNIEYNLSKLVTKPYDLLKNLYNILNKHKKLSINLKFQLNSIFNILYEKINIDLYFKIYLLYLKIDIELNSFIQIFNNQNIQLYIIINHINKQFQKKFIESPLLLQHVIKNSYINIFYKRYYKFQFQYNLNQYLYIKNQMVTKPLQLLCQNINLVKYIKYSKQLSDQLLVKYKHAKLSYDINIILCCNTFFYQSIDKIFFNIKSNYIYIQYLSIKDFYQNFSKKFNKSNYDTNIISMIYQKIFNINSSKIEYTIFYKKHIIPHNICMNLIHKSYFFKQIFKYLKYSLLNFQQNNALYFKCEYFKLKYESLYITINIITDSLSPNIININHFFSSYSYIIGIGSTMKISIKTQTKLSVEINYSNMKYFYFRICIKSQFIA